MRNSREFSRIRGKLQSKSKNRAFKRSNEILYLFYSANKLNWPSVSKIGVQKCLYLSEILSPLREIILSFLNFIYLHRGPYSKDVQNTLDYLVSVNALEAVSFTTSGRNAYVDYRIIDVGKSLVEDLIAYSVERKKLEWIELIMKLVDAYEDSYGLSEQYSGVDRIIDLVYQEPSFKELQHRDAKRERILFGAGNELTIELIDFLKTVEHELPDRFEKDKYKLNLETILLSFFEYLYVEHLSQSNG